MALILLVGAVSSAQTRSSGMYARAATPVWDLMWSKSGQPRPVRIPSPDGANVLIANAFEKGEDSGVQISIHRGGTAFWNRKITPAVGIEIGWASDSKAFFVTTSNAGRNGGYELALYFVKERTVQVKEVTPLIQKAFGHPVKCGWKEDPNVAAVKWVDSSTLIVAAEIMNHSNCDSYGTFRAYEVALPELRITKEFAQIEAKRMFSADLGWELKDAPDQCIRHPKSCWIPANHSGE